LTVQTIFYLRIGALKIGFSIEFFGAFMLKYRSSLLILALLFGDLTTVDEILSDAFFY